MSYVIKRIDQGGGYLAPPGSRHSYTKSLANARAFSTREKAEAERCCENEVVVERESLMKEPE